MKEYDFMVIGSGIASLNTALKRPGMRGCRSHETQGADTNTALGAGRNRLRDQR
jgi:hypothetical protein